MRSRTKEEREAEEEFIKLIEFIPLDSCCRGPKGEPGRFVKRHGNLEKLKHLKSENVKLINKYIRPGR